MGKRRRKRSLARPSICACGGPKIYAKCCKPFHKGDARPDGPVTLMKSRYTAYSKGLVDYVIRTTDPDGAAWEADEARWRESIETFGKSFEFTGVEILDTSVDGDRGTVMFRAGLTVDGRDESFVETSLFRRIDGAWFYASGDVESE